MLSCSSYLCKRLHILPFIIRTVLFLLSSIFFHVVFGLSSVPLYLLKEKKSYATESNRARLLRNRWPINAVVHHLKQHLLHM